MEAAYLTPTFVHVFDVIVLGGLVHYYRQLGYRFLLPGIMAVSVGLVRQLVEHVDGGSGGIWMTLLMGSLYLAYGGLMATSIHALLAKPAPLRFLGGAGIALLLGATYILSFNTGPMVEPVAIALPGAVVLAAAVVILVRRRPAGDIGPLWLAGLLGINVVLALTMPLYTAAEALVSQAHLFDDLVHLLTAVALLMITSERTLSDLQSKEARIEQFTVEQKQLELQFTHAQKLESLGVLANGIAHDFNNMLTSILGYASLALKKLPTDSEVRKDVYMVMSGARQAADLTSQMLIYAGKGALEFERVDVSKVVDNMSGLIHSIVPKKIHLVQKLVRGLPEVMGDKVQLGQVLINLIANAVDAVNTEPGVIEITTDLAEVDQLALQAGFFSEGCEPGPFVTLRVRDTGVGMNEAQVERIFDPFYTEKENSKGLGLSSISGIVRQHKGFVKVQSRPGEGSEFTMFFPVASAEEQSSKPERSSAGTGFRGNVLLADDDTRIRSLIVSILEGDRFRLTWAEDGEEALRLYEEADGKFDLLVLDCAMPKMSGAEIHRRVRDSGSTVPIVLVSGYYQEQVARDTRDDPNTWFVKKPFTVDDFLQKVHTAVNGRSATAL